MESLLLPHLVDDLEHPRVQPGILDPELLGQAAPVHEIVAGLLAATLLGERDLRVWEEPAHDVRQLAGTHGDPARVVERVARGVGQQHTGEDLGDVLHVNQETHEPFLGKVHRLAARGKAVHLPKKGLMRLLIHVEDIAEVFARVLLADAPRHALYNSGGIPVSPGELADIVRGFLPDAQITFADEGGREDSGNYLVDWSRLAKEFGIEYPGLHTRVLEAINEVRQQEGLPLVGR